MIENPSWNRLKETLQRLERLHAVESLLEWDEQVNLPPAAAAYRGRQRAELSALIHREQTAPEIGQWLDALEADREKYSESDHVVLRFARREYDRETKLPLDFVRHRAESQSHAYHAWLEARHQNDFPAFAPHLEEQIRFARQEAAYLGHEDDAYDYWIDRFDPGMDATTINELFTRLKQTLVPLVRDILGRRPSPPENALHGFPVDRQERFLRSVLNRLGLDFNRTRLDRSPHPFCSGNRYDTRLTTRFFEDNPMDSLFSSIHEAGHGLYEQGLPEEHLGTALGEAAGMTIHESQSRLWENQVGRSRAFWTYWEPQYRATFPDQLAALDPDQFYRQITAVRLNPIRVDADEVTYNLHIILRFELEQLLFRGDLAVSELPETWNRLSRELLGLTPKNDAEGVLQDVHWSGGAFGYFPSYCLGNMLAAQLWYTAQNQVPNLDESIRRGEYSPLLDWLRQKVHRHGKLYDARKLARRVTGKELGPEDLIRHLKECY